MVQVQKSEKKAVYRYLLQEGVIVIHKDFTTQPHKGTNVPNIHARLLLRSLKDRGLVELVFSWQYYYYFINEQGKKYLSDYLNLTEEVVPLTWKFLSFYLEKTKRDNMSTSSRIKAEKSEETEILKTDLKAKEEEEEVDLEPLEIEENNCLLLKLKSQQKQPKLDLFARLIFQVITMSNFKLIYYKFKCLRHLAFKTCRATSVTIYLATSTKNNQ
jgi:hypothetical protein